MPSPYKLNSLPFGQNITTPNISSIADDSRCVEPGGLFVAVNGHDLNGELFIPQAIANGAKVIVTSENYSKALPSHIEHIKTPSTRKALSFLSKTFYPNQPKTTVAITGTNGKSSVAHFVRQLWSRLGHQAASIGTLGIAISSEHSEKSEKLELTSPGPIQLHRTLNRLATEESVTHCVFEASSHALYQHRIDSVTLAAAGFTNLSQDHLDYHKDMDHYFEAKSRLFKDLLHNNAPAILNADVEQFPFLQKICEQAGIKVYSYGTNGDFLHLKSSQQNDTGCALTLRIKGDAHHIQSPFKAQFQTENVLCAMTIVIALGENPTKVFEALPTLTAPPGRMEFMGRTKKSALVYVDFAHTPDALERALKELKAVTKNRLHVVFGCGGERDQGKRQPMGKIAHQYADQVYVTDDNPRREDRSSIRQAIMRGAPNAIEHEDRKKCIEIALESLEGGDILLVAGKGHENLQIIGTESIPLDDREIIKAYLFQEGNA